MIDHVDRCHRPREGERSSTGRSRRSATGSLRGGGWSAVRPTRSATSDAGAAIPADGTHVAFTAPDGRRSAFHEAGLAAGETTTALPASRRTTTRATTRAFVLDPDGNNIEAVCHQARRPSDLDSGRALGAADRRAARDARARSHARARAHRAACGRDRRVARVPVGRRRALPRARALRAPLRGGLRRLGHRDAALADRDRGDLEGLRDERAHPRRAGARLARAQARRDRGAEGALPSAASRRASGSPPTR